MRPMRHDPAAAAMPVLSFQLGDLHIDGLRQQVWRDGQLLPVQGLSWQLLWCLLQHGDAVVGFDSLMAEVWAPALVNEETITQRIKLLRQALGDDGRQPRYVRSVRGRGYQLCAPPVLAPEAQLAATAGPAARTAARSPRWWVLSAILAAIGAFVLWVLQAPILPSSEQGRPPGPRLPAVLERANWYAGIGQQDDNERAIALYQQFLAGPPDPAPGWRTQARIRLSHALSARVCLYNQPFAGAQEALDLADAVLATSPGESAGHAARGYALDCLGRIDGAMAAYRQAIALDPAARQDSVASLANLLMVRGQLAEALSLNVGLLAAQANQRLLPLQLARVLELLGASAQAERLYREQFTLLPDHPFVNLSWPRFLANQGRDAEAAEALVSALQRPRHVELHLVAGELALRRGDRAAATAAFALAARTKPASWPRTLALLHASDPSSPALLRERAAGLREALGEGDHWPDAALELAVLHTALADRDVAFAALGQAVAAGYRDRAWLQHTVLLTPLRDDPRFAAVLMQIDQLNAAQRRQALADPAAARWLVVTSP